jgi:hypothetical protein
MFRKLTKLAPPARLLDPHDPANRAATGHPIRAETFQPKSSASASPGPDRLRQIDLSLSFNLLDQAIKRFSDLKPKTGQVLMDARLLEELRRRLIAHESERSQLQSDLEYAQYCAHSYWDLCQSMQAELDQLKSGTPIPSASEPSAKRGVL